MGTIRNSTLVILAKFLGFKDWDLFIVEKAENSKLKVGNTFFCSVFVLGAPLYLTDLVQGGNTPVAFVAGKKDGLCEIKKL